VGPYDPYETYARLGRNRGSIPEIVSILYANGKNPALARGVEGGRFFNLDRGGPRLGALGIYPNNRHGNPAGKREDTALLT